MPPAGGRHCRGSTATAAPTADRLGARRQHGSPTHTERADQSRRPADGAAAPPARRPDHLKHGPAEDYRADRSQAVDSDGACRDHRQLEARTDELAGPPAGLRDRSCRLPNPFSAAVPCSRPR